MDRKTAGQSHWGGVLSREMAFERAFVNAGGTLLAGADPTGWGAVVAGYADQRGLDLLVSAGLNAEQAVAIATANGTKFLHDCTVGTITPGMQADLVVLNGNPSHHISDVRNGLLVSTEESTVLLLPSLTIDKRTAAKGLDILARSIGHAA
jgi:hypothetical protein